MSKQSNPYQILDDYCLRTPMFSLSFYKSIFKNSIPDFKLILSNPVFREALFLASPELFSQVLKWEKEEIKDNEQINKLKISILKYCIRISTRCTPFGMFAFCSYGKFNEKSNIELNSINQIKRITKFDTIFLTILFHELLKNETIKQNVLFFPNTSIYKVGDDYRYIEYKVNNIKRNYSLEGIKYSSYLEETLDNCLKGKTISELAENLTNGDIAFSDANEFINMLIDTQVLVSELEISITGEDYFKNILKKIKSIPKASKTFNQLKNLQSLIIKLDNMIGNNISLYNQVTVEAKKIAPKLNTKYLFQTDCFSIPVKNTLENSVKKKLNSAFLLFNKITLPNGNRNMINFKKKFIERYAESEVSLNLVLDIETGIGYGDNNIVYSSILPNINNNQKSKRYNHIVWTDVDSILQNKLETAYKTKQYTIYLNENDFKYLPFNDNDLPDTMSSIIELYKADCDYKIYINSIGGSSSTNLLGRFCEGDKKIEKIVNQIVNIERKINSEKILAEIVHLPESRSGNILKRPNTRGYEIPYLAKSNLINEYQIPLEDILISVKNDTIKLRSKKLNKYILPKLGNAHNFTQSKLPIYLFLCELQTQNQRPNIGFRWNRVFLQQKFLPRIEYLDIIISKARWNIFSKDFLILTSKKDFLIQITAWKVENKIPNLVELVEGDNRLLIDLTSEISIEILCNSIKNSMLFSIEEFLFTDNEIVINQENKSFCNQFIVSFYNERKINNRC